MMRPRPGNSPPVVEADARTTFVAASGENAPADAAGPAIDFLYGVSEMLPASEGAIFRNALDRLEAGESFQKSFSLPSDWRRRERDRLLRQLRSFGLSGAGIETALRQGTRSSFAALVMRIVRLDNGHVLCARQIRRIVL
jgi:hypothetical protein